MSRKPFEDCHFVIGMPYSSDMVPMDFCRSILNMDKPPKVTYQFVAHTITSAARNLIAAKALHANADYVFFLDTDMVVPQDVIKQLWSHDKQIVSGLYMARRGEGQYFAFKYEPDMDSFYQYSTINWSEDLLKIDGAGTGCLLINTDVFRQLEQPFFYYNDKHPSNKMLQKMVSHRVALEEKKHAGQPVNTVEMYDMVANYGYGHGEDLNFFYECYKRGIETYLDTKVFCGHVGMMCKGNPNMKRVEPKGVSI